MDHAPDAQPDPSASQEADTLPILNQIVASRGLRSTTPEIRSLATLAIRKCPSLRRADIECLRLTMIGWGRRPPDGTETQAEGRLR